MEYNLPLYDFITRQFWIPMCGPLHSVTDSQHARPVELLQSSFIIRRIRRRQDELPQTATSLLNEKMLTCQRHWRSGSVHGIRISSSSSRRPAGPELYGAGQLLEEKLQDPERRRRRGGGEDHQKEGRRSGVAAGHARRRRVQPHRHAGRWLRHGHGFRCCHGPHLPEAVQALDVFFFVRVLCFVGHTWYRCSYEGVLFGSGAWLFVRELWCWSRQ